MYRIHITFDNQPLGADAVFAVTVLLPGQSSGTVHQIGEHNLRVILNEIVPPSAVNDYLRNAYSSAGAVIEVLDLSEQRYNMLRGLLPRAVRR